MIVLSLGSIVISVYLGVLLFRDGLDGDIRASIKNEWPSMADGSTGNIRIPAPFDWDNLTLRFALKNNSAVGNCVTPAELEINPFFDQEEGVPAPVAGRIRSNETMNISLRGALGEATVYFILHVPDPECVLDVRLAEARLSD